MALTITKDDVDKVLAQVEALTRNELLVGIPGDAAPRTQTGVGINNAALGYIQEFGSPAANIPARPFLRPGIQGALPAIIEQLRRGAKRAMAMPPDPNAADQALHAAGIVAQREVRRYVVAGVMPPLSPRTLAARRNRKVAPRTGTTPLLDTGQLYRSVQHVIRKR